MSRRPSIPFQPRTLHVIGDTHFGGFAAGRQAIVKNDLARSTVPQSVYRIQVGDFISTGVDSLFDTARAWMDSLGGDWWAAVGNHDLDSPAGDRTPDEAAALMGMPAADYTVDLGFCVLVVMFIRAPGSAGPTPDYTWLTDTLDGLTDRVVFLVGHPPLVDINPNGNVGLGGDTSTFFSAEIMAIIDPRTCVKAYLCGHTHPGLNEIGTVMSIDTGTREIAQLTNPCAYYTTPDVNWTDGLWSMWVTVYPDRFEVRARDHGAHQWVGSSLENIPVWVFPL